jgi:hypothetical protein
MILITFCFYFQPGKKRVVANTISNDEHRPSNLQLRRQFLQASIPYIGFGTLRCDLPGMELSYVICVIRIILTVQ